jgi:hypothetical protein
MNVKTLKGVDGYQENKVNLCLVMLYPIELKVELSPQCYSMPFGYLANVLWIWDTKLLNNEKCK